MASGRKSLRRLQIGRETVAGTSAAATIRLRVSEAVIEDVLEIKEIEEQVGILGGPDRTAITKLGGKISIGSQPVAFQVLPYFMAMGLGAPTLSTQGSTTSADRLFIANIATNAAPTVSTYTFEGGDDFEVERMTYGFCPRLVLEGSAGDTLNFSADIEGRGVTTASNFATTATLRNVEDILVSKGKVYIDAISGSFGATQIAGQILGVSVGFAPQFEKKFTADGSLDFNHANYEGQTITGALTMEVDTVTTNAKYDWRQQTPRLLRLLFQGSQLTTATDGKVYTTGAGATGVSAWGYKTLCVDLPIKWTKLSAMADQNGNDIVTGNFRARYNTANSTAGNGRVLVCLDASDITTGLGPQQLL